jgi:hypothetical protein
MIRFLRTAFMALGVILLLQMISTADLRAYTIVETQVVQKPPYSFKMEVQVKGRGSLKKGPFKMTALKVKIKNERARSEILKVKTIRIFAEPKIYTDVETVGYPISPGKWVTKYYRLRKEKQLVLGEGGYVEICFENFVILFYPRERKFEGPFK